MEDSKASTVTGDKERKAGDYITNQTISFISPEYLVIPLYHILNAIIPSQTCWYKWTVDQSEFLAPGAN